MGIWITVLLHGSVATGKGIFGFPGLVLKTFIALTRGFKGGGDSRASISRATNNASFQVWQGLEAFIRKGWSRANLLRNGAFVTQWSYIAAMIHTRQAGHRARRTRAYGVAYREAKANARPLSTLL